MNFMRDGGFTMWLMVFVAIAVAGGAVFVPRDARPRLLASGSILVLIVSVLGLSLALDAVSKGVSKFPDPAAALAQGLGESSNNGILGAALALALGVAALITRARSVDRVS